MNKVILMLVEGPSDEDALCGPTAMAISNMLVKSDCFYTDVTTANLFSSQASFEVLSNVENTVQRFVESHIEKNQGYDWKDLAAVVHVVDLDGALVSPSAVVEDRDASGIVYGSDTIKTPHRDFVLKRNREKKNSLAKLYQKETLGKGRKKVPYRIYFMSRNLEHALYGASGDLDDKQKERLSIAFSQACANCPGLFLKTLRDEAIAVKGNYEESWRAMFKGANSLHRGSNYHLLFEDIERF